MSSPLSEGPDNRSPPPRRPPGLLVWTVRLRRGRCRCHWSRRRGVSVAGPGGELLVGRSGSRVQGRDSDRLVADRLPALDLRGQDLTGRDLAGADLTDAVLESADLHRTNLTGAKLIRARLDQAHAGKRLG